MSLNCFPALVLMIRCQNAEMFHKHAITLIADPSSFQALAEPGIANENKRGNIYEGPGACSPVNF